MAAEKFEDSGIHNKILTHPPCSLNISPSDMHLFGSLKDAVCSIKFDTDVDMICAVRTGLHEQDKAWCWLGMHTLPCWHEAVELDRAFVEK
jgi:hypothetical protein